MEEAGHFGVEMVEGGLCGGECGVILKFFLRRISELEGAMESLKEENRVLRSEAPNTGVLPIKTSNES